MKRFMAFAAACLLAACHDSTAPGNLAGKYSAIDVNGAALPANVGATSTLSWALVSGTLTVNADGTWRFDQVVRYTRQDGSTFLQDPPATDAGTYTIDGDHVRFANPAPGGAPFDAQISGAKLVWSTPGMLNSFAFRSLEFSRQ